MMDITASIPPYVRFLLKCAIGLLFVLCSGCATNQMERNFFEQGYDSFGTRFESYLLENQIKIYLYGMQSRQPPITVLSRPIAERGLLAKRPLLAELKQHPTDQNIKDLMIIFETMQRIGSYDVQRDKSLMKLLDEYVDGMKNAIWKKQTKNQLAIIKAHKDYEKLQD